MKDFSFQGKVYLGTRLAGAKPGAMTDVGDAPTCNISLSVDTEKRKESRTGQRLESAVLQTGKSASIALTLNYFSAENLVLGVYGTKADVAGGTATGEVLPAGLVVGNAVVLEHGGVSALVITDSTGAPLTLTPGTDYDLDSANGGVVVIKSLGAYVQPFKAAYSYTASVDVTMFTSAPPQRYLMLDGTNTVTDEPVRVRLYKVQFEPVSEIQLINSAFGELSLTGTVLYDDEAILDADLGPFGKIEQPTAVA